MDLTQLRTAIKRYGFDDSDPIDVWLNMARHEIFDAAEWPFLETKVNIDTAVGSNTVSLPGDFFRVISLRDITNKGKIFYQSFRQKSRDIADWTSSGQPTTYTLYGMDELELYPVPDGVFSLELVYEKQIEDISDASPDTILPVRMHPLIVFGAAAIALQAENEEDRAQAAQARYDAGIARALSKYSLRELDEPHQVQDTADYFGE